MTFLSKFESNLYKWLNAHVYGKKKKDLNNGNIISDERNWKKMNCICQSILNFVFIKSYVYGAQFDFLNELRD